MSHIKWKTPPKKMTLDELAETITANNPGGQQDIELRIELRRRELRAQLQATDAQIAAGRYMLGATIAAAFSAVAALASAIVSAVSLFNSGHGGG